MAKISRNAPCPCGSGNKYKRCCLGTERDPARTTPAPPLPADLEWSETLREIETSTGEVVDAVNRIVSVATKLLSSDHAPLEDVCYRLAIDPMSLAEAAEADLLFRAVSLFPGLSAEGDALHRQVLDGLGSAGQRKLCSRLAGSVPTIYRLRWLDDGGVMVRPSFLATAPEVPVHLLSFGPPSAARRRPTRVVGQLVRHRGLWFLLGLNTLANAQLAAIGEFATELWEESPEFWDKEVDQYLLEVLDGIMIEVLDPDGLHELADDWEPDEEPMDAVVKHPLLRSPDAARVQRMVAHQIVGKLFLSAVQGQRFRGDDFEFAWDRVMEAVAAGGRPEASQLVEQVRQIARREAQHYYPYYVDPMPPALPEQTTEAVLSELGLGPEGTLEGADDAELQRAPWELLLLGDAHPAGHELRSGAPIGEALDWAERHPQRGDDIAASWRTYRAEARWMALADRVLDGFRQEPWHGILTSAALKLFDPRFRDLPLAGGDLKGATLTRLHNALVQLDLAEETESPHALTVGRLGARAKALLGCAGFAKGSLLSIHGAVFSLMRDWRWQLSGVSRERPAPIERPPEAMAALTDGLDELASLFE